MLVQCPSCHTTYKVSDSLISAPNPTFRCSRCKHIFVLGLNPEPHPAREKFTPAATTYQEHEEEDKDLSFSFPPPERKEAREEKKKEDPGLLEPKEPSVTENPVQEEQESPTLRSDEPLPPTEKTSNFRMIEEQPPPTVVEEHPPPTIDEEQPSPIVQEEPQSPLIGGSFTAPEENPSLQMDATPENEEQPSPMSQEEPQSPLIGGSFIAAEENRSVRMDAAPEEDPSFEEDWQTPSPPSEEREAVFSLDPYRGQSASTIPYISLFGALLLIYSLLLLTHQTRPRTMEAFLKIIPGLGSSVFKNNHLRQGIALQSLRPGFQTILGNRKVFVVSGVVVNRTPVSVREVRVEGHIYNGQGKAIERQDIWVGNAISSKIIRDLTAQEISILQKLSPQKRFEISPEESANFVIIFLKPSGKIKDFSCRILSAEGV